MAQYNNRSEGKSGAILGRPRQAQSTSVASVPPPSKVSRPSASVPPPSKVGTLPPSKVQKPARPSLSFHSSFEDEATRVYLGRSSEAPAVVPQDEFAEITAHTATDVPALPQPQRSPTLPKVAQNPFTSRPALPTYPTTATMDSCSPVAFPESTQSVADVSVPAPAPAKKMLFVGGGVGIFAAAAALVLALASSSNGTKSTHVRAAAAKAPAAVQAMALDAPPVAPVVAPEPSQAPVDASPVAAEAEAKVVRSASRSVHAARPSVASHPAPAPAALVRAAEPPPAKVTKVEKHAPQIPVAPMDDDSPKSKLSKAEKDAIARAKATAAEAQAASDNSL